MLILNWIFLWVHGGGGGGVAVVVVGVVGSFWVLFGWVTVGLLLGSWVATGLL